MERRDSEPSWCGSSSSSDEAPSIVLLFFAQSLSSCRYGGRSICSANSAKKVWSRGPEVSSVTCSSRTATRLWVIWGSCLRAGGGAPGSAVRSEPGLLKDVLSARLVVRESIAAEVAGALSTRRRKSMALDMTGIFGLPLRLLWPLCRAFCRAFCRASPL